MVVVGNHSPKRRRTDNGPISANAIAQTNSTIQFFTGQRQNRWMQGVTPLSADETPVHTSSNKQTSQTSRSAVNVEQEQNRQSTNAASAMDAPSVATHDEQLATSNLVQYESPPAPNMVASTVNNTSRKSAEAGVRVGLQPGLPSPVSSDGNRHSPAMPQQESTPKRRAPGRPRLYTNSEGTASVTPGNISPVVGTHQRVPSQPQRQQFAVPPGHSSHHNQYNAASEQQHTRPVLNSQPFMAQPSQYSLSRDSALDLKSMRNRLDLFERKVLETLPPNTVDRGRLTLLRDAIEKGDMLYIVLSQIHSLTNWPAQIPQSARKVDARAFHYLDMLLCPNKAVSPAVLEWLSGFPFQIKAIYNSVARDYYDTHVRAVASFLEKLPLHWEALVSECKKRQAPPLMDDLFEEFQLNSPVLQTTAFRAIARMIWDVGTERLEELHSLDQQAFSVGRKRSPAQKSHAYQAYQRIMQAWREHQQHVKQHVMQQRHRPERQRVAPPNFVIPQEAMAAFQIGSQIPIAQPVLPSGLHGHMSAQQQAAMLAETQRRARMQQMLVQGRMSPAQIATAQQHPPSASNNGTVSVLMPAQQTPPGLHLVFPHESEQPRAQPTQPDRIRSALHQAHLRSPLLGPVQPTIGGSRLYRYVSDFAMSPTRIDKDSPIGTMSFDISQELIDRIPTSVPSQLPGESPTRIMDETSQTVRLRCAAIPPKGCPNPSSWMETDNCWPDNLFLECNGEMLEPRRKLQHHRYLPVDLSPYVKEGQNELTVMVNRISTDTRSFEYALAVEVVSVWSHETIKKRLRHIEAAESLEAIKKSLSGTEDDDEVAITSSNLTIKLFDPYSNSKMFETPVRGSACLHKDCFDLETFLSICKRERPEWPTVVDCWRCPICRGDVRPNTLVVDGFLDEVRKQLAEKGQLETRAIIVEPDGSWKPKVEEQTGVRSPSLEREERSASAAAKASAAHPSKKMPEIIEID